MRPKLAIAFVLLALGLAPAEAAAADASWPDLSGAPFVGGGEQDAAVVVGIEKYAFVPPVPGARLVAGAWHEWLTSSRGVPFERVALLRNADATAEAIREAATRAASQAGPGGTLWFVFIGHGAPRENGNDGILVGVDAQQKAKSLQERGVARSDLLELLAKTRAGQIRVVLDACFSGRAPGGQPLIEGLQPLVVTATASADARFAILSAARGDQYAGPIPGTGLPAFSYLVLGGLRGWADSDRDGSVTAGELTRYAEKALRTVVRDRDQTPMLAGDPDAPVAPSGREKGPDLAALARRYGGGPSFEVTGLADVPQVSSVSSFDAAASGLDLEHVEVEALEQYDRVVKLDRSDAPPAEKSRTWRALASSAPLFRETAIRRAMEWDRLLAEQQAAESARAARKAARDKDWARLSRLLPLEVVPPGDKQRWAIVFVAAYGDAQEEDPYIRQLAPFLPKDASATTALMAQLASTLSKEGNYDGATALYLKAYERSKELVLLYDAARVQDKKGDLARAKALYERYLAVEHDADGLKRGRARLAELANRVPGRLVVVVEPAGAQILVDGRELPAGGPVELKRGTHAVVAKRDGYVPERRDAEVTPGDETRLQIRLKALPGSLSVECDVIGAQVATDGKALGTVPLPAPVALPPGHYVIEVTAPGYERFAATVDVDPGAAVKLPVTMAAVPVAVPAAASSEPAGTVAKAPRPSPRPRSVRVPLSLAFSEGFLRYSGATQRTHAGMETEVALRFAGAPWIVPGLGIAWTLESQVSVTLRAGIQWYFGSFPMFVRTAVAAMVTPDRTWAFVGGLGGDVPLWKGGFLRLEADAVVWSKSVVPMDFAVGVGHAF